MDFDDFYALYPRKISRLDAQKAWSKLTLPERVLALSAIPAHVRYWTLAGTDKAFIPYPATWLNGERWTDEIELPRSKAEVEAELAKQARPGEDWAHVRDRLRRNNA